MMIQVSYWSSTEYHPGYSAYTVSFSNGKACFGNANLNDAERNIRACLPSPKTCLHGDFHIGNIITNGEKDYWIDLGDFAYGAPDFQTIMGR